MQTSGTSLRVRQLVDGDLGEGHRAITKTCARRVGGARVDVGHSLAREASIQIVPQSACAGEGLAERREIAFIDIGNAWRKLCGGGIQL
jgi:hypothetical protein